MTAPNTLFYGDNLPRLRHLLDESVDLIYLDPPFNSARSYNLLFKQQKGDASPAQIMAFEDTWKWSNALYDDFKCDQKNAPLVGLMDCLVKMLGRSEMMAYLLMMGPRLMEMHRTLRPTGSLYLHCDSTALGIFGSSWTVFSAHRTSKTRSFGSAHPATTTPRGDMAA